MAFLDAQGYKRWWRWPVAGWVLYALIMTAAVVTGRGGGDPPWLGRALELAGAMRERGVDFLGMLPALSDPRLGPATILAYLGLSPDAIRPIFQLLAALCAVAAIGWLGRTARPRPVAGDRPGPDSGSNGKASAGWGTLLLAAAPLTTLAALRADPHLALGLVFLGLGSNQVLRSNWGRGALVLLLAWGLSWSPWAWLFLWLPLTGTLMRSGGRRLEGPALMLISAVLVWLLHPAALMRPGDWVAGLLREMRVSGLGPVGMPMGLEAGWWPLVGSVHVVGLALLVAAAATWPARLRAGDFRPLAAVAAVVVGLRSGFVGDVAQLIVLPWACAEIGAVLGRLRAGARMPAYLAPALGTLAVGLLLIEDVQRLPAAERVADLRAEVIAHLEASMPAGSLVLHDAAFTPPKETELVYLELPFHAARPDQYRAAYWPGWYHKARALVTSEQLLVRFLRDPTKSEHVIAFYADRVERAVKERTFGEQVGRRIRVLSFEPDPGEALGPGWRGRLAAGQKGGLPAGFPANLGGVLVHTGEPGAAADLLEESLAAGFRGEGVYLNLSNAYLALDRVYEAGRVLDEGGQAHPQSTELTYNLGIVLTRTGMWDRAVRTLLRVQREWPDSAPVSYLLGLSLANSGRSSAAIEQLERALALDPRGPERPQIEELLSTLRKSVGE